MYMVGNSPTSLTSPTIWAVGHVDKGNVGNNNARHFGNNARHTLNIPRHISPAMIPIVKNGNPKPIVR